MDGVVEWLAGDERTAGRDVDAAEIVAWIFESAAPADEAMSGQDLGRAVARFLEEK